MTPDRLSRLPTVRSVAWWDAGDLLDDFLGEPGLSDRIDGASAARGADGFTFETKLEIMLDDEDGLAYVAVMRGGRLLGLMVRAGDTTHRAITDYHGWEAARDHAMSYVPYDRTASMDVVDPYADLPSLTANYGCRTVRLADGYRLAREEHCDGAGCLMLDDGAFREAFRKDVMAAHSWDGGLPRGEAGAAVRRDVAGAIRAGLVGAVSSFVADVEMEAPPGRCLKVGWIGVIARTDEGTYAVGVPSLSRDRRGFNWIDAVQVVRIGDAAQWRGLAREPVTMPDPTPSMFES